MESDSKGNEKNWLVIKWGKMKKRLIVLLAAFVVILSSCNRQDNTELNNSGYGDTPTTYTITFVFEDGTNEIKVVQAGENLDLLPEIPTRIGYDGAWEVEDFSKITSNVTVKLLYTPKQFTIYYDLGECENATITSLAQTVSYDEEYELYTPYLETIVDYDYQFVKWVETDTQEEFQNGKYEYVKDIYLTAVWQKFTPDF